MKNPTLIIDMSTVVRHDHDPGWHQLEDVVSAWKRDQDSGAVVLGVADNSLWYELDEYGKEQFNRWQRSGLARRTPHADPVVCELAEKFPYAKVLTRDKYRDLRRKHPWLQGSDRFFSFSIDAEGVQFTRTDMGAVTDEVVSQFDEQASMKPKRLNTPDGHAMLRREWTCDNALCPWSAAPVISELPVNNGGVATCPKCDAPLRDAGEAAHTREIKVIVGGAEVAQLPVVQGGSIVFGRGGGEDRFDVRSLLDTDLAGLVSRDHLRVANQNGNLLVEDLGSKNGTELDREDGTRIRIEPGVLQRLALKERITLARGAVVIRLSGKRNARGIYVADRGAPVSEPGHTQVIDSSREG